MSEIRFTRRALADLDKISKDSIERYGQIVTDKYMAYIEDILKTITEYPNILIKKPFAEHVRFFVAREHMLVFSALDDTIYLLTVKYGGMDIENIISRLEPALVYEAEIMHDRLRKGGSNNS